MSIPLSRLSNKLDEPVAVEGFVFDNVAKNEIDIDHVEDSPGLGNDYTPDPVIEKKLVRKLDLLILPAMCLLYTGSSLDRSNIGNAKTIGLIADLGGDKTGHRYALLNGMFYIGYVNWMIVAGIVGKKTKMNVMLSVSGIVWGIAAACMGAINTWEQGYAVRYLVGLGEAGFAPLVTVYLARWYTRRELALRVAFWLATAPVAGIVNGLLAYGVSFIKHSIEPWRLLFIIEGGATVCAAVYCLFVLPGDPESSSKLSEEERVCMRLRKNGELSSTQINWKHARTVFYSWQFLIPAGMYQVTIMLSTALGAFLPTLVQAVGYTGALAQVYTLPPYAAGGIAMMLASWLSGRFQIRGPFVMTGFAFLMLGFALLAGLEHTVFGGRYAALVFAEIGQYILLPLVLTWAAEQAGNESRRAVGMPFVSTLSQAMGIPAGYLFPSNQGPQYRMGAVVALSLSVWGLFLAVLYFSIIKRENKRKEREEEEPISGMPDVEGLAHNAPGFRYAP